MLELTRTLKMTKEPHRKLRFISRLHLAAKGGYIDLVELLLNYGADPNLRDNIGYNAAYFADQAGNKAITTLLPGVLKITTAQMSEFREQYLRVHDIVDRRKKVKKKGGAKKKK